MFSSLRARLWLTYVLLIAVILGISAISLFVFVFRVSGYANAENRLRIAASLLTVRIEDLPNRPLVALQRAAAHVDNNQNVRILLIGADGTVALDSRAVSAPGFPSLKPPFRVQADDQVTPQFIRDASGAFWLYRIQPLDQNSYVMVAVLRPKLNLTLQSLLRDEFVILGVRAGGVALFLSLVLALVMNGWITAPLRKISKAAGAVARGEYQSLPLEGPSDVRELARAFNEMTGRVQSSQQSQRDFVANISHELKTPLTSIQGFAQAILDGTANTPQALQQAAGVIHHEAGRMNRLVLDLLTLARLEAGTANLQRAPFDLAGLLRAVAERLTPQANSAQVDLRVDLPMLPGLVGDEDRLAQVFTNLVDNAIKYSGAGGRVLLSARSDGAGVRVSVADTGPGLSPADQARIFERFYQADKSRRGGSGRGVGLGLAIAREIVQAHGGTIQVDSAPGKGSTFCVRLPLARLDEAVLGKRTQ
ncbi:MAG TPA: HAMP domain-containing sensor histidine kinase [Anaerolineaceae bacterium]|jgi:signal transduction histidine kinase